MAAHRLVKVNKLKITFVSFDWQTSVLISVMLMINLGVCVTLIALSAGSGE